MELRTRFLPKLLNSEVDEYLKSNDIIIVPVGTVEMHGGLPLDSETVISEAFALKMAEACDGLVVGSPVYYASANATLVALLTRLRYRSGERSPGHRLPERHCPQPSSPGLQAAGLHQLSRARTHDVQPHGARFLR